MCYVVCHYFHDMYTLEDKIVIDCVFESKEKAKEYCSTETDNEYWYEEVPLYGEN